MSEIPTYDLELRAADERRRLQNSLEELKGRVHRTFDMRQALREHMVAISCLAALASLTIGYGVAAVFQPPKTS